MQGPMKEANTAVIGTYTPVWLEHKEQERARLWMRQKGRVGPGRTLQSAIRILFCLFF